MNTKFRLALLTMLVFSCKDKENKTNESIELVNKSKIDLKINEKQRTEETKLTFEDFKNSKWIIGSEGINGEKPDTIIFDKPNTLIYIGETGREKLNYSFSKDTLIYTNYSSEFDMNLNREIQKEIVNRFIFKGNKFIFLFSDEKNKDNNTYTRTDMKNTNLSFNKIK